jgi:hypothetical protein
LLEIANFLYNYRPDKITDTAEKKALHEKDRELIDLACVLLENSFYEGSLLELPQEQAAVVAFMVNVLAKIFEQSKDAQLRGFSKEKLADFISGVHDYEQEVIFHDKAKKGQLGSVREDVVSDLNKELGYHLVQAEQANREMEWGRYFAVVADKLDDVQSAIETAGIDDVFHMFSALAAAIRDHWQKFADVYVKKGYAVRSAIKSGREVPYGDLVNTSLLDVMLRPKIARYHERKSNKEIEYIDNIHGWEGMHLAWADLESALKKIQADVDGKIKESESKRGQKKTFTDFTALAQAQAKIVLKEASQTLAFMLDNSPKDGLGGFLEAHRALERVVRLIESIKVKDLAFMRSEERLRTRLERNPAATPYLIKAFLIARSMTKERVGVQFRYFEKYEDDVAVLRDMPKTVDQPVYEFIPPPQEEWGRPVERTAKYAQLHYVPEELPFSVWAFRYLKSKQAKTKS